MKLVNQQIIISGVGGQGVLFVTRLMAETAMGKGFSVFTSETHGMAQRGGTVLSHFKVGSFSSPLVRPSCADGLLALKGENLARHGYFVKPGGWVVINGSPDESSEKQYALFCLDADKIARKIKSPKSVNLIMLGFALARLSDKGRNGDLFCGMDDVTEALGHQLKERKGLLESFLKALRSGYEA
jgi:indolepyruvate ferredoxin oxidoreductase beta subunit